MSQFIVNTRPVDRAQVLALVGYLDAHTAGDLEQAIQSQMDADQINLVVNFRDLTYISSAGLGVFMAFIEEIRDRGGDIKLAAMSAKVYNVFDLLGFPLLYEIYDDEAEALSKFAPTSDVRPPLA